MYDNSVTFTAHPCLLHYIAIYYADVDLDCFRSFQWAFQEEGGSVERGDPGTIKANKRNVVGKS